MSESYLQFAEVENKEGESIGSIFECEAIDELTLESSISYVFLPNMTENLTLDDLKLAIKHIRKFTKDSKKQGFKSDHEVRKENEDMFAKHLIAFYNSMAKEENPC